MALTDTGPPISAGETRYRRRVAIAFVDVVGFSALMADDEIATFDRWNGIRQGFLIPGLARHRGRLVKSTGDGILAVFDVVRDAVLWSQDVQRGVRGVRTGLALRIALNWCDVLLDEGDPIGDGVNLTAHLQERAAAGGVIATRAVVDAVAADGGIAWRRLGLVTPKHGGAPVEAFDLVTDGLVAPRCAIPDGDRPSIAVLPLRNAGGDPDDDFFAQGVVEDVALSLAALRELVVISRQTTAALVGQVELPTDVGRLLGVRYVLSGALRRAGGRLRVALSLDDAASGETLWQERVTIDESDLFLMQDTCVERVVTRIAPQVRDVERRRALRKAPESFTAYEAYLRGLDLIGEPTRAAFERGYGFLRRAMELDAGFAMAMAWAARCHSLRIGQGWSDDPDLDSRTAATLANDAIQIDRHNALALATYGHIRSYLFADYDVGASYLDRARDACPSSAVAWLLSSANASLQLDAATAVTQAQRGLDLSPYDPHLFLGYHLMGLAHFVAGQFDEAARWCHRSRAENPAYTSNLKVLAAAQHAVGDRAEAAATARRVVALEPSFRLRRYADGRRPFSDPEACRVFAERLRAAGIPD